MSKKLTPIAAALGTAFALSVATSPVAADSANPFAQADLVSGYSVAMGDSPDEAKKATEGKCGEGKCGADKAKKAAEGKCGEGKCGADKAKKAAEGKCGGDKAKKAVEGKCGEGKCGAK